MIHPNKGASTKAVAAYLDSGKPSSLSCPKCGGTTRVIDSRPGSYNSVRRRRACCASGCLYRFSTYEVATEDEPIVDVAMLSTKMHVMIGGAKAILDEAEKMMQRAASLVGK